MASVLEPNKTKIAKRVFEIFEFFCDNGQKATVMDIVRRYGRPQSSTSELLSSLVEMGLLYKDPHSRSYTPTPRIAALGTSAQPEIIRDGGLFTLMDRLAEQTGRSVALFGMVNTHVQVFRLAAGIEPMSHKIAYGASEQISASAAGLLLLSTFAPDQAARMLWRLNAEAEADEKFDLVTLKDRVAAFRRQGYAVGDAGFSPDLHVAATLLPRSSIRRPLALGVIFRDQEDADTMALVAAMNQGIAKCAATQVAANYYTPAAKPYKIAV
jgi:DNA-binding IclR family transcriptional regulator